MLPDVSGVLAAWAKPYTVKTVTRGTVDFEPADVVVSRTIQAVVQPAQRNKLNPDQIDWSKRYLQIHTIAELANGEYLEYGGEDYKIIDGGEDYKIIDGGDYQLYGYVDAVAEQTKQTKIEITP